MKCPHCQKEIPLAVFTQELGRRTSVRKAKSSRENGKLGGRPKKQKGKHQLSGNKRPLLTAVTASKG